MEKSKSQVLPMGCWCIASNDPAYGESFSLNPSARKSNGLGCDSDAARDLHGIESALIPSQEDLDFLELEGGVEFDFCVEGTPTDTLIFESKEA
jgi:hypothetical protein